MVIALSLLGLFAGALTTVAGQGGGLVLLLACSAMLGPHAALVVTAPALLLGNTHRAILFRRDVDRSVAARVVLGAVPGAFASGLLVQKLPPWTLDVVLVVLTAVAVAKAAGLLRFDVPRAALFPAGLGVGVLTGTAGGAGIIIGPLLLASGLTGARFVGTGSAIAMATHVGRVAAYGTAGLFARDLVFATALLAVAIFLGNALGERLRGRLGERVAVRLEYGVLFVCVALSLAGLR